MPGSQAGSPLAQGAASPSLSPEGAVPSTSSSRRVVNAMGLVPGGPGALRGSAAAALPLAGGALDNPGIRNWWLNSGRSFIEHLEQVGRPHPATGPGEGGSLCPTWHRARVCRLAEGAPAASSSWVGSPTLPWFRETLPAVSPCHRQMQPQVGTGGRGSGQASVGRGGGSICPAPWAEPQPPGPGRKHGKDRAPQSLVWGRGVGLIL